MKSDDGHYLKRELYSRLKSSDDIFEFLISGSLDGVWYWNIDNPIDEWMSPKFWEILGYDPKEKKHLSSEWQDLINQDDLKVALNNFKSHCEDPNVPYDQIVRYKHKNGSTVWVRCRGIAIRDERGKAIRMLGAHNDVTSLKNAEFKSYHDELTSLYNRHFLFEELSNMLHRSIRRKEPLTFVMFDVDNFKKINDSFGHVHGDDILENLAKLFISTTRGGDICCRYGGEEFVALLPNTDIATGKQIGERIRKTVDTYDWKQCEVKISVGISTFFESDYQSNEVRSLGKVLLKQADDAMYFAKRSGKNRVIHHSQFNDKN